MIRVRPAVENELDWINSKYGEVGFLPSRFDTNEYIAVAEEEGTRMGLGRLVRIDPRCAELGGIYVFNEFRGKGLAKQIIRHLLSIDAGYARLYCLPFSSLESLYRRAGFRELAPDETASLPAEIRQKFEWCNEPGRYAEGALLLIRSG